MDLLAERMYLWALFVRISLLGLEGNFRDAIPFAAPHFPICILYLMGSVVEKLSPVSALRWELSFLGIGCIWVTKWIQVMGQIQSTCLFWQARPHPPRHHSTIAMLCPFLNLTLWDRKQQHSQNKVNPSDILTGTWAGVTSVILEGGGYASRLNKAEPLWEKKKQWERRECFASEVPAGRPLEICKPEDLHPCFMDC